MPNQQHEIKIALVKDQSGEHAIPIIPDPGAMHVGDTVRYVSSDGELRVEFPKEPTTPNGMPCKGGSPFKDGTLTLNKDGRSLIVSGSQSLTKNGTLIVSSSQSLTLERGGLFECRCFLTLPDGRSVKWTEKNLQSGGVHDIQPH